MRSPPNVRAALLLLLAAALAFAARAAAGEAAEYPSRSVRLMVPAAAGSALDSVARTVAARLSPQLGQAVLIENQSDAARAFADAAHAPPDGHTLLLAGDRLLAELALQQAPDYELHSFAPITLATRSARVAASAYVPAARAGLGVAASQGFLAPAGTPGAVLKRLNREIVQILRNPEVSQSLAALGHTVAPGTPAAHSAELLRGLGAWMRVAHAAGARPD
ncbi:MAG: hypothetical protein IPK29_16295 [Betaproteobacteria bacterium]|nr:hypothetical protein [Betaproteobacteria bacterium]